MQNGFVTGLLKFNEEKEELCNMNAIKLLFMCCSFPAQGLCCDSRRQLNWGLEKLLLPALPGAPNQQDFSKK